MNKPNCKPEDIAEVESDLKGWLEKQAKKHHLKYLLAHADDGVIWGEFRNENFQTSGDVFSQFAQLRLFTLQQCRIFGQDCEVMLWKVNGEPKARFINDKNLSENDSICENDNCICKNDNYICERQILWGTNVEQELDGFTLVSDGSQGLRHVVPLSNISHKFQDNQRPLRLTVRHYIDYDESGIARIYLSRLVNVFCE
ncbi:MAG: CRISPR-associated protein Csx19 [Cyanobacteriota bacterium]|nr:CRISPR-associated protein Csx19 [Cyanobacteriota bacterium]